MNTPTTQTKTLDEVLASPALMTEWANKKGDYEVVGRALDVTSCPCARCFKELCEVEVKVETYTVTASGEARESPEWLTYVVEHVDEEYYTFGDVLGVDLKRYLQEASEERG